MNHFDFHPEFWHMKEIIVLSLLALSLEFSFMDLQSIFHQLSIFGL